MTYTKTQWLDHVVDTNKIDPATGKPKVIQEGTPVSAGNLNKIEQGIEDAHKQMEQAAKETVLLPYGLSVLNSPNGSPLDVQIEGRTLVSLGNSELEGGKYYVLADPKFAVTLDGTTYKGITKFVGKNVRPVIIRTANLEGKTTGNTIDNPHIVKHNATGSNIGLISPINFPNEVGSSYNVLQKQDGVYMMVNSSLTSGAIAQTLFSFNLIEEIERKVGKIPGSTVTDKVAWLKSNITRLTGTWYGFGSSAGGNKANFANWRVDVSSWNAQAVHTKPTVTGLSQSIDSSLISLRIDSDGFVHFLAYAETSDGVTASIINTDYVELEIELKSSANFYAPRVPLYEVPQESYDKILVEWDAAAVANRYSMVEGVKSLQNPVLEVEGENLIPPFNQWTLNSNTKVISPYELQLNATANDQYSYCYVDALPNTEYTLSGEIDISATSLRTYEIDSSGNYINPTNFKTGTFKTFSNTKKIMVRFTNSTFIGASTCKDPTLVLGVAAKPFKPRNPSYLYAETILRGFNNVNDLLYQDDGRWKVFKKWEEVLLDGANPWVWHADYVGYKALKIADAFGPSTTSTNTSIYQVINHLGAMLKKLTTTGDLDLNSAAAWFGNITGTPGIADVILTIPDTLTGWADSYTPTSDEIKAYFNGWKVKTVDGSNKPTAWASVLDGKDAPMQTLTYVIANKAPDYLGYRLFYQLSTPKIDDITDKVEGSLSVSGQTQLSLDSGLIIKEKVTPYLNQGDWIINANNLPSGKLVHFTSRILAVYKNRNIDTMWRLVQSSFAYGNQRAVTKPEFFDSTAEYFVTYILSDKENFTVNPVNARASYNTSIRSTVDQMNEQLADVKSLASIHDRYLYKLLLAAKANGWSV